MGLLNVLKEISSNLFNLDIQILAQKFIQNIMGENDKMIRVQLIIKSDKGEFNE